MSDHPELWLVLFVSHAAAYLIGYWRGAHRVLLNLENDINLDPLEGYCICDHSEKDCKTLNHDIKHKCQECGGPVLPRGLTGMCMGCAQDYVNG